MNSDQDNQPLHGSIAVFPLDTDAEPLLAFRQLFPFQIAVAVDSVHPSLANSDASLLFGQDAFGIPTTSKLIDIGGRAETVLLFDVTALSRASHSDMMRSTLEYCLESRKAVFALGPQDPMDYDDLYEQAKQKGLAFQSSGAFMRELIAAGPPHRVGDVSVPVVLVLGTSFNQGKFKAQLSLKSSLSREGYQAALVGTNPLCALMTNGFYVPQDPRSRYTLDLRSQLPYWESMIAAAFESRPHFILVGAQGHTVSPRLYEIGAAEENAERDELPREVLLARNRHPAWIEAGRGDSMRKYLRLGNSYTQNDCRDRAIGPISGHYAASQPACTLQEPIWIQPTARPQALV